MKTNKISIVMLSALAAVAGAFTSCSSEDDNALLNQPEKENQLRTLTVNAGIDNGGTRVTLDENDETKVLWTVGDEIELVCEGYADTYTFSLPEDFTGNAATATFEGAYNPEWTWEEGNEPYFQYLTESMLGEENELDYIYQTGLKKDLWKWMFLKADASSLFQEESNGIPHVTFKHQSSVIKVTMTHPDFANKKVMLGVLLQDEDNEEVAMIMTVDEAGALPASSLVADENGQVTGYYAIPVEMLKSYHGVESLTFANGMVSAAPINDDGSMGGTYVGSLLAGKTLEAGKLIKIVRNKAKDGDFIMEPTDVSETATVTLGDEGLLDDVFYEYTGEAVEPGVTVELDGQTLTAGTDYYVSYTDNIDKGTATVTVTFMGNYKGTVTETFEIVDFDDFSDGNEGYVPV